MIVYRLEHGTHTNPKAKGVGHGPASYDLVDKLPWEYGQEMEDLMDEWSSTDHPSPWRDPKLGNIARGVEVCGVESMDWLYHWFGQERIERWAEEYGFVVRKYDVPGERCRVGQYGQVLFESRKAVPVEDEEKGNQWETNSTTPSQQPSRS